MGETMFWELHGIDPLDIAEKLWASQDLTEMQLICSAEIKQHINSESDNNKSNS